MKKVLCIVLFVAIAVVGQTAFAGLAVVANNDATDLTGLILGSGITLVGTPVYSGATTASGSFTGGLSAGIGINTGLLMTSGSVFNAPGPNNQDGATSSNGFLGDANLNALIPGFTTFNAAVLQFDFTSAGGDLFFNYVFASEEYNEYTNSSFNDVFGFFLDGVNIALIPGTTTPVSINNVNGGNPFGSGASNPSLYNNNDLQDGGPFFDLQYDGFTDVFTAQALDIAPGTHSIKLAIADAGDTILDSGVFIQGGTFSDTQTPVPEPGTIMLLGSGLVGLIGISRKRFQK